MKFKLDENLPAELLGVFQGAFALRGKKIGKHFSPQATNQQRVLFVLQ